MVLVEASDVLDLSLFPLKCLFVVVPPPSPPPPKKVLVLLREYSFQKLSMQKMLHKKSTSLWCLNYFQVRIYMYRSNIFLLDIHKSQ